MGLGLDLIVVSDYVTYCVTLDDLELSQTAREQESVTYSGICLFQFFCSPGWP